jgi:MFS family permease
MATQTKPAGDAAIWRTFRESPLAVKAILAGVFVNRVGGFLNIFLVLYLVYRGYSTERAALGLAVYGGGTMAGVLLGGALANRLGARNATVISMASSTVLIASLLYLPNYGALLVAVAAVGLVGQMYRPASTALLSQLTPDNRQVMIFAMYRFGLNLGTVAAPLIGFALYNLGNQRYDLLFWGEAAVALVYAVLAQLTLPARDQQPVEAEGAPAGPGGEPAGKPTGSYREVLRDGRYTLYLVATFLNAVIYVQYLSTLPLDVHASGVKIFWYTFAVSLNGLLVIALELLVTKVTQRWPARVSVGVAFAVVGIGVACYGLPLGPAVIITGTLIWTLAEIIGAPAAFAYPASAGPPRLKAQYIGAFQFMFGLGSAVGPIVGGELFVVLGHRVWPVLAGVSVLAVVCVLAGLRPSPPQVPPVTPPQPAATPPGEHLQPAGPAAAGTAS